MFDLVKSVFLRLDFEDLVLSGEIRRLPPAFEREGPCICACNQLREICVMCSFMGREERVEAQSSPVRNFRAPRSQSTGRQMEPDFKSINERLY
jgi:hypothetical protein